MRPLLAWRLCRWWLALMTVTLGAVASVAPSLREPAQAGALWRAALSLGVAEAGETYERATSQDAWVAFNRDRAAARERGARVFGPTALAYDDFRAYLAAQMAATVRQALTNSLRSELADAALRLRYERERHRFVRRDTIELTIIEESLARKHELELRGAFEAARQTWARTGEPPAGSWHRSREKANDYAQERADDHRAVLYDRIDATLPPGSLTGVIVASGVMMLARLETRAPGGHVPFEAAKSRLVSLVIDEHYRALLDRCLPAGGDIVATPVAPDSR